MAIGDVTMTCRVRDERGRVFDRLEPTHYVTAERACEILGIKRAKLRGIQRWPFYGSYENTFYVIEGLTQEPIELIEVEVLNELRERLEQETRVVK